MASASHACNTAKTRLGLPLLISGPTDSLTLLKVHGGRATSDPLSLLAAGGRTEPKTIPSLPPRKRDGTKDKPIIVRHDGGASNHPDCRQPREERSELVAR
ncbi:hypothetical protein ASPZODRAFT_29017 [Penicilliopsis zonata CBS 506.65]|uniref:Uncharacterized protein n=1 Tax=Penicilliopsis zonata CBS 506.65 TaxID=1073090 RepID=A0A1L9S6A6_9EURO|nr:hypothetical protein ASPZODRAFT_29017 [Penicilliopsis zonata CBS 506.65]OJJ42694.1 hypothetical protein ASPZODRAFT_29017 [Penicilliopsis zonata CBS 506.65]